MFIALISMAIGTSLISGPAMSWVLKLRRGEVGAAPADDLTSPEDVGAARTTR